MQGYWAQFIKVAVAHMLAVASPGPDFAMVVRQSLAHGRRAAVWTSIGVGTAILVHVTYAVLGIGILLRTTPAAFMAVKLAGAAYLAWIGAKALMSRP
ncbi:MAG TPA: LysE family translocator, partial [Opitutaceae bacterium]|nr:LysE family translocator [Opitutaceae bacterium]